MMDIEEERKKFEVWYDSNNDFMINTQFEIEGGWYLDRHVRMAWKAWLASKESQDDAWISIKVGEPEPLDAVLLFTENSGYTVGTFEQSLDGTCHFIDGVYDGNRVTHWMPLPQPPLNKD